MTKGFRLTGDHAFIALLEKARDARNLAPGFDYSEWLTPALNELRDRTAVDVIALRTRYSAPSVENGIWISATDADVDVINHLFHQFSITMPAGVRPLPWPAHIIITIALTIFCENAVTKSKLRLV